jgi:hypothetical protein
MPDDLAQKLANIDTSGKNRFGDDWTTAMEAIRKAAPQGINPVEMAQIAAQGDPAGLLMNLGRHALMDQASNGDAEAERAYAKIRQKERRAHAEFKGRVWQE